MPESISVSLNQHEAYDVAVHNGIAQASAVRVITKDGGMESGAACAVLTFQVERDGKVFDVQATTTVRLLKAAFRILDAKYDDYGMPK